MGARKNIREPQPQKLSTNCVEFPVLLLQLLFFKQTSKKKEKKKKIKRDSPGDRTAKLVNELY